MSDAAVGEDLIGVRATARRMGLTHSTISRYLRDHEHLNHGSPGQPKIDFSEFRQHHADTVNPLLSGSHAGRMLGEDAADEGLIPESPESPNAGDKTPEAGPDLPRFRAANLAEDVARKRRERLQAEGLLLPKAAVEEAFFACGRRVRRKIELIETWSEELAAALPTQRPISKAHSP